MMRDIGSIKPYENNPRKNKNAVKSVASSIQQYGFQSPIIVDKAGVIVAGHTRFAAAQSLGLKQVPVLEAKKDGKWLTEKQCRALRLADNRTAENSGWDNVLLVKELEQIKIEFPKVELTDLTFFTEGEINGLMGTKDEKEDRVPTTKSTKIKAGDVYEVGGHRLVCGDNGDAKILAKLMGKERADMVFTDPPYGVSISKKNEMLTSKGLGGGSTKAIHDDELKPDDLYKVLVRSFTNLRQILSDCCSVFVTAPQGGGLGMMMMMMMMMKDAGLEAKHVLIWKKNSPTFSLGRLDYDYQHEPILLTWTKKHIFYGQGQHRTSVWDIAKPRESKLHPTMKPVELVENALLNNSKKGDICVDIYGGSGTTLIACEKTGRFAHLCEIDPLYCQTIIDRWEEYSGKKGKVKKVA